MTILYARNYKIQYYFNNSYEKRKKKKNFIFYLILYFIEKAKRPQKVQATQTEGARAVSPVTPHKIKSVSQKTPIKKIAQLTESPKSAVR